MKKTRTLIVLLISILTVCLALAACGKPDATPEYSLDTTEVTLMVGDTHQIKVSSTSDAEFTVVYESDTPDAASVSDGGLVTAVKPGTAKIKATVDGNELVLNVTVEHKYALNKTTEQLSVGDTLQLNVITTPNKNVTPTWTVAPEGVVTVSESGLVSAVAEGDATVTATVDGKTLDCKITVTEELVFYTYTLNHVSANLEKGSTLELVLTSEDREEFEVEWESADTDIATVDENGVVTAVKTGKTTVEAKVDGEVVGECAITVFEYVYEYPETLSVDYGDEEAEIEVTVTPSKTTNYTYELDKDGVITVDTNGKLTTVSVGTATVTIKDGEKAVGACVVTVNAVVEFDEKLNMHVGDVHELAITEQPAGSVEKLTFAVTDGADVVQLGADGKTLTALKNGTATVKATADGKEMTCTVNVSNLYVTEFKTELLEMDKENPIDIGAGAEYWEQYIATNEINHKRYDTSAEDVIERTLSHDGKFLPDYKAWLAWSGGANGSNCTCGKCNKDTQNGGDGGWTEGGTKAYCTDVLGSTISLDVKVFPGQSTVKVYTGGYNLKENVTVKIGDDVLGTATIDNKGAHNSNAVVLSVDVKEPTTVTVVLEFADDYGDTGHSVMSLAGASVSGDTYRLSKYATSLLVGETEAITVVKNENESATNVTYASDNGDVATVDADGVVTAVASGNATITVTADGRVRTFAVTVNMGYTYSVEQSSVFVSVGNTHQINVVSDPVGAEINATYASADENIATVDANGLVTAVGDGVVNISVVIDDTTLTVSVTVLNATVTTEHEDIVSDKIVDLTEGNIVYWEHYIYNEPAPKAIDESAGERDLIDGSVDGKNGDANSTIKIYYKGSSGVKENALDDGAFHKFSWGDNYDFDVTVPAGKHEIRVYTGVWKSTNKVSLSYGDVEIDSYTFESNSGGLWVTVKFVVESEAEHVYKLKINALTGNNCRLKAIAIADVSVEPTTALGTTVNTVNGGDTFDLTAEGILDWATFGETNHEKEGGEFIDTASLAQGAVAGNANDYAGSFKISEEDADNVRSFKFSDEFVSVNVKVDSTVSTLTLYATGWNSDYFVTIRDSKGNILSASFIGMVGGQSCPRELVYNVSAAQEETLTIAVTKLSTSNCGIAAVVVGGDTTPVAP